MTDITKEVIEDARAAGLVVEVNAYGIILYANNALTIANITKFAELTLQRQREVSAVPEGWQLVPIALTEEMEDAADEPFQRIFTTKVW